jgi:hypothetical protein
MNELNLRVYGNGLIKSTAVSGLILGVASIMLFTSHLNELISALLVALAFALISTNLRGAICASIIFLFLLGDIRRITASVVGSPSLDPLLLIGPFVTIWLVVPIFINSFHLKGLIDKLTFALMVVMLLEVANPRQGGLTVGLAGVMFMLVPVLWYWVGRRYGTIQLVQVLLYRVIIPLGTCAALLGFYQTFVGFLPWEQAWIDKVISQYSALNVGGFVRAFGFSVNAIEYADLLLISCAVCVAAVISGKKIYAFFLPLLIAALFLESSRGPIIKLVLVIAAAWACSREARGWIVRFPVALLVIGCVGTLLLSSFLSGDQRPKSAAGSSIQHQANGLLHPTDSRYSTATVHSNMFLDGVLEGIKSPLGFGIGATTLASGKLSDSGAGSTEVDISDVFVSLGLAGGAIYSVFILAVLRVSFKCLRIGRNDIYLPIFSVLFGMVGVWLARGQYAVSPLMWLLIGALVRAEEESTRLTDASETETQPASPRPWARHQTPNLINRAGSGQGGSVCRTAMQS